MIIEMKRRDYGHTNEHWKLDIEEKAVLIDPAGKAVAALGPVEALSRFRMPGLRRNAHDFEVHVGNELLTFSVNERDLRQIECFLNRTSTATEGKRNSVKTALVALVVFACLAAFVLWRSLGSGAPPAQALAQNERAPTSPRYRQNRSPRTPARRDQAPTSRPEVEQPTQDQLFQTALVSPALVLREEATAIEGLRECALCTGRYPESLAASDGHLTDVVRQLRENPPTPAQDTGLDPGPARTRDEKIVCVCRLMSFYTFLRGKNREPAYYGQVVKPGEAERILLRWRLGANEYRVIYGDLHVETVPAEQLARLEAALPR
jgi:hypothetical protein